MVNHNTGQGRPRGSGIGDVAGRGGNAAGGDGDNDACNKNGQQRGRGATGPG